MKKSYKSFRFERSSLIMKQKLSDDRWTIWKMINMNMRDESEYKEGIKEGRKEESNITYIHKWRGRKERRKENMIDLGWNE